MTSIINRNGVNINLDTVVNDLNGKADVDLVNLSAEGKKKISSLCRRSVLGELVQSTIPLTDPGLHLLNGAVLTYDIYEDFIDYIADLYNKGTYTQLFETEANWQAAVTQYGVCGKFVYNSETNTVRLPKITGMVEGTTDVSALGDLVEAGLPNIEGELKTFVDLGRDEGTGAIRRVDDGSKYQGTNTGSGTKYDGFDFDASRSSSIYGNSDTVQPQTIKVLYYIVVAGVQGTGEGGGGGTAIVDVDGITITKNEDQQIQTVAVLEDNKGTAIKTWTGTKAEYDAITTKDASTIYNVTDDYTPEIPAANVERIGQIISSTIPLKDAGLHLLDGSVLQRGIYKDFVDYMAELYTTNPNASYFAQTELPFTQPLLTANGTLGGDSFAVAASSVYSDVYEPWGAFDGDATTASSAWVTATNVLNADLTIYNPIPIKVTSIQAVNRNYSTVAPIISGTIYGSNDNSEWTEITTFTNSVTGQNASWTIDLSSNTNFYKYYKLNCTSAATFVSVGELSLTATYLCTAEEWWQYQVEHYGVCGKFVYDATNNTVRLPKVNGFIEGCKDLTTYLDLGNLVEAGLPNITGTASGAEFPGDMTGTGAFANSGTTISSKSAATGSGGAKILDINASLSNSIYGNSTTVQPQAIKVLYYIVVANSTKTEIEVDIDEIATDLNGKADVDLTNCTDVADIKMAHNAMPSDTYVDLTLGASDSQYVMPADGWLVINKHSTGTNQYAKLLNQSNGLVIETRGPANNTLCACYIPVKKGDTIVVGYSAGGTLECFRFIYAKGSESEAQ